MKFDLLVTFPLTILLLIILFFLLNSFFRRDKSLIFSPMIFISLYFIYYIAIPYFTSSSDFYQMGSEKGLPYLMWGALINYTMILLGYKINVKRDFFRNANRIFTLENAKWLGTYLFILAFFSYGIFNGFSLSFLGKQEYGAFNENASYSNPKQYLTNLIALFPSVVCLLYASCKSFKLFNIVYVLISISIYLIDGFRFRLVLFVIPIVVFCHLYPKVRKINYALWIPFIIMFYFSMGVIENSRHYGNGLDIDKLMLMKQSGEISTAKENVSVYYLSANVMKKYSEQELIYFEPILTAICMPLPRALFPWKPDGLYLRRANIVALGSISYGGALLNFTEAYIAFSWLGIILNGLVIGLISKIFWNNYKKNKKSIGAILLLGLFNGVVYVVISRGYLAQQLTIFAYYIPVLYWASKLLLKFRNLKKSNSLLV